MDYTSCDTCRLVLRIFFFFQAEDGIRDLTVTGVQTCALPISSSENLIHHAYHLARFEEQTHRRVDDLACVLEFGGGYGSMCRLFHNLGFRGRYLIFDLPAFSALQRFFLRSIRMFVGSPDPLRDRSSGVALSSNVGDLHTLVAGWSDNGRALFPATWSISENPLSLPDAVLPPVYRVGALCFAHQL